MPLDQRHPTWANSNRFVARVFVRPFLRFSQVEAASGFALLSAAAIALVWANSPWAGLYHQLFQELTLEVTFGPVRLSESVGQLINDGLMAVFFFVVGLEIKRELVLGELRHPKAAALPVVAALGGMIVPALIYTSIASGAGPESAQGWGIPMATDIAFAVGIIALLGRRVPASGKLFILALAIADDIGAISVIALFYTSDVRGIWLGGAVVGVAAVVVAQRAGIRSLLFYGSVAGAIWYAMLESGVHATLAGVALGLLTPARAMYSAAELDERARRILDTFPLGPTVEQQERADHEARLLTEISKESISPLNRLEHRLLPWSSFLIVPLFALANAGISFAGADAADLVGHPVALGVGLGLLLGKPIGITLFAWLAVRLGIGRLPAHLRWSHVLGLGLVAGIGFTVSLFVTGLAFTSVELSDTAKIGIFGGSILAAVAGAVVLASIRPSIDPRPEPAEMNR